MTEENRPVGKASEGRLLWMYDKIISVEEFQHIVCAEKIKKKENNTMMNISEATDSKSKSTVKILNIGTYMSEQTV